MRYVYMLRCSDGSYYTGITTDIERRLSEHNTSSLGAKYTKARRPVTLVWAKEANSRSEASKEERRVKKLKRAEKEMLISM